MLWSSLPYSAHVSNAHTYCCCCWLLNVFRVKLFMSLHGVRPLTHSIAHSHWGRWAARVCVEILTIFCFISHLCWRMCRKAVNEEIIFAYLSIIFTEYTQTRELNDTKKGHNFHLKHFFIRLARFVSFLSVVCFFILFHESCGTNRKKNTQKMMLEWITRLMYLVGAECCGEKYGRRYERERHSSSSSLKCL